MYIYLLEMIEYAGLCRWLKENCGTDRVIILYSPKHNPKLV